MCIVSLWPLGGAVGQIIKTTTKQKKEDPLQDAFREVKQLESKQGRDD